MAKNLFIALEGIDGSGKSTQAKLLAQSLVDKGHKVHLTFEPTNRPIGAMIRSVLRGEMALDERAIAGLFVADRLDHLLNKEDGMLAKLEDDHIVITDRYYFSSYAYHSVHMDMDWVIAANALSAQLRRPDMTIFIDVSPEVSMSRLKERNEKIQLYETLDNLKLVRANYIQAFQKLEAVENVVYVEGNNSRDMITRDILAHVENYLME